MKSFSEFKKELTEGIENNEKRYVVTIEMYMWDKDDKSVIKQAEKFAKQLRMKYDNDASVESIYEQETGTMTNRKVL